MNAVLSTIKPITRTYIRNPIVTKFTACIREAEMHYGVRMKFSFSENEYSFFVRIKSKETKKCCYLEVFKHCLNMDNAAVASISFGDRNPNTAEFVEHLYDFVLEETLETKDVTKSELAALAAIAMDHLNEPSKYFTVDFEKIDCVTDKDYLDSKSLYIRKITSVTAYADGDMCTWVDQEPDKYTLSFNTGPDITYDVSTHKLVRKPREGYFFLENDRGNIQVISPTMAPHFLNLPEGYFYGN